MTSFLLLCWEKSVRGLQIIYHMTWCKILAQTTTQYGTKPGGVYQSKELAAQLVTEEIIGRSHHCLTEAAIQIKSELLVLGALSILSGSVSGF